MVKQNLTQARLFEVLDYDRHSGKFRWKISYSNAPLGSLAGNLNTNGYRNITIDGVSYKEHRLVWLYVYGELPRKQIDHVNCIPTDNRICNLRLATHGQNQMNCNKYANNTSGFKGVDFYKRGQKWRARANVNKRSYLIGYYATAKDAYVAYCNFIFEHHGAFARAG